MRKFLAFILLAVPFVSFAQTGPQLYISNLQTDDTTYRAGQEITGSFLLSNTGSENVPDVQYYVAVGNLGNPQGGLLDNETAVSAVSEALYLPRSASMELKFGITPTNLPAGDLGLHVVAAQKNGMILGWSKVPLTFEGERPNETQIIEGYFDIDGEKYDLDSGMPFAPEETASFFLQLPEGAEDGTRNVTLALFEKSVGGDPVSDQVLSVEFVDGVGEVSLPEGLKPKIYAGQVSIEGSNVLGLNFMITGPQAEVLSVDTDLLSMRKGQDYTVRLEYADTPLNGRDPQATEYPQSLSVRLRVVNEKGELVNEYEGPLEVTQKQELLVVNEDSTEEEQAEATRRLEIMLNNQRTVDVPLVAGAKAKNLALEVELFDAATGEVYDTYKTTLPASPDAGYPARGVLLATFAIILILLVIVFKKAKHKIPMVCLTLVMGSLAFSYVLISAVQANTVLFQQGNRNSHTFVFAKPAPSSGSGGDGYDTNEAIPLDLTVTSKAWASNGFLAHYVRYPVSTNIWSSFSSAGAAMGHITSNNNYKNTSLYNAELKNATFKKSFNVIYLYNTSGANAQSPNLTPGKHYLPVSSTYCTASHGCSGPSFAVREICVNGIGVCPGEENLDICTNLAGNQTSVPEGYVQVGTECRNDCSANMGDSCGCEGGGTIQCDGSCSISNSCPGLNVSCSGTPNPTSGAENVTFTASVSGGSAPYTYSWSGGGSAASISRYITADGQLQTVTVTDDDGLTGDSSCGVDYQDVCTGSNPYGSCGSCEAGVWTDICGTNTTIDAEFSFEPNIVGTGQACRLIMEADNVSSCYLVKNGSVQAGTTVDAVAPATSISIDAADSVTVPVGTYTLHCRGIDAGDVAYEDTGLAPQQCLSKPVIIEN